MKKIEEFDIDQMRWYMRVPIKKKLEWLEEMHQFFDRIVPKKNKKIAQKLREKGF